MTTDVGSFSFTVPAIKGLTNSYDDIGNFYRATYELGYDSTYTHLFSGRVLDISTEVAGKCTRTFTGKGLGELLERRVKRNKRWQATAAEDIVDDIAADLSLTCSRDNETTAETITVNTESYFDILKKVSDYWYDASTQVKMDFGINKDGELFWKTRPIRTVGVESINKILAYNLKYTITNSKNNIRVLGASTAPYPVLMDDWTDSLTDWTATVGTLSLADAAATTPHVPKAGTYWISCLVNASSKQAAFYRVIPTITTRSINKIKFWEMIVGGTADVFEVRLFTDNSNYFYSKDGALTKTANKVYVDLPIGDGTEYDVDENPSGTWIKTGTPNWYDINQVGFFIHQTSGIIDLSVYIDKLHFYPEPWQYSTDAEDSTNQTVYGEREAEYVDANLNSAAQCQSRQETLLYQQKDRILRLDFTVPGNTNILLGDRIPITLPIDNVSAVDFDVASVTHVFKDNGYLTTAHCLNTANTRRLPPLSPMESIKLNLKGTRDIVSDIYTRIVR
jgi:hypothetical protein